MGLTPSEATPMDLADLSSIRNVDREDGIDIQEARLIAQHCLFKSPYLSRYQPEQNSFVIEASAQESYVVRFKPRSQVSDPCSLAVTVDRKTQEVVCACQAPEEPFALKTGYLETEDKHRIHYNHYQMGHKKVVILAHGFYNSKEAVLFIRMAQDLCDAYDVILFDLRGHGLSSGLFTWTAKSPMDLERVLAYASDRYSEIGLIGFSLGAATSIITTAETDQVRSLIAVSAPTAFSRIDGKFWQMGIQENIIYNVFEEGRVGKGVRPGWLWLQKTDPIDVVDRINVPTLFLHGKRDWLISPWHAQALFDKARCPKALKWIEKGTHAEYLYRRDPQGTINIFKDWLHKTMGKEDRP
jgi:hypothetical protein